MTPAPSTPLAKALTRRIAEGGPITVRAFMDACLTDPEHGYYRTRPAIGGAADFITAPEISQTFGELLGLWSAVAWQAMGAPSPFQLVELGPGRGTMMADALRALGRVAGFAAAVRIVLVEPSPVLREMQRTALGRTGLDVQWVDDIGDLVPAPSILLANELFDVLPITQVVRTADGWRERTVVLDAEDRLSFSVAREPWLSPLPAVAAHAPVGALVELRDLSPIAGALARIGAREPVAALFIDYGHEATGLGDTLQAVRRHAAEPVFEAPGKADLTAHVDFEAAARAFTDAGFQVERLSTQGEFLGALGIAERASRLMSANPARAGEIEMAVARLMAPEGMGSRFKVLGVRSPGLPPLPGFHTA